MRKVVFLAFLVLCGWPARASTPLTASDTGACTTAGACLSFPVPQNAASAGFQLSGTFSATLQFEGCIDNCGAAASWFAVNAFPLNSATAVTSATAIGAWRVTASGLTNIRIRCSAFTSGTANASISFSLGASANGLGGSGGGGSGTVTNVSGTANQVDVATGTTTPVISLDSAITLPGSLTAPSGGSVTFSGTGTVNANQLLGATVPTIAASTGYLYDSAGTLSLSTSASNFTTGTLPVGQIPTAIPIGSIGSAGLSGTAPISIAATGVISGGGLGTVNGALKGNGSGVITQAACADLSNAAASCSTDATNASNISSGTLAVGRLPTAIPIANVGSSGLSGTAPITISAAGAIACATCATSSGGGTVTWATPTTGTAASVATFPGGDLFLGGINAQTGTSYTFVSGDENKLVSTSNASAVAVTLPQATTAGFGAGAVFHFRNLGAGTATITPTTSTIDGVASLAFTTGQGADIYSDGTNYTTNKGAGGGGAVSSVFTRTGAVVAAANDYTLDLIGNPAANASFTFPSGNTLTLAGTAPASSSGAGTTATSVFALTQPTGGATTGSATTAGAGAPTALTCGGAGGSGAGGTNAIGGTGGSCTITAGAGGASSGTAVNPNGGNIILVTGAAGTGGSGTAGNQGTVQLGTASTSSLTDLANVRKIIGGQGSTGNIQMQPSQANGLLTLLNSNGAATEFQIHMGTGVVPFIGSVATVGLGLPAERYNTAATSQTASQSATTMVTSRSVDTNYEFSAYVAQLNVGTSCSTAGSVGVNLIYTDPVSGTAYTFVIDPAQSGGSTLGTTVPLATSGIGVANVGSFYFRFRAKASTAIQYSTTYTAGTGCSPGQAYNIYPELFEH